MIIYNINHQIIIILISSNKFNKLIRTIRLAFFANKNAIFSHNYSFYKLYMH